ncbi:MAG: hypothetical protein ACP5G2_04870 [Candidatus Bipolaricaulaceae bacterium]
MVSGAPTGSTFQWDFDGDGVAELTTNAPRAACTVYAGYRETVVTVVHGGRVVASAQAAVVADDKLGAVRTTSDLGNGAFEVTITLVAKVPLTAPGLVERVPADWALEMLDSGGAQWKVGEALEAVWPLKTAAGDELSLRFRLYAPPGAAVRLSGQASGYGPQGRVEVPVAGVITLP